MTELLSKALKVAGEGLEYSTPEVMAYCLLRAAAFLCYNDEQCIVDRNKAVENYVKWSAKAAQEEMGVDFEKFNDTSELMAAANDGPCGPGDPGGTNGETQEGVSKEGMEEVGAS